MKKEEFKAMQEELQKQLRPWWIEVGDDSRADFVIGCYFDNSCGEWVVYQNHERGWHSERVRTKNEEEAFDELYSLIKFEAKLYQNHRKRHNIE